MIRAYTNCFEFGTAIYTAATIILSFICSVGMSLRKCAYFSYYDISMYVIILLRRTGDAVQSNFSVPRITIHSVAASTLSL